MLNVFAVIVTVVLLGCEGSSHSPPAAGFVNQTQHPNAELQAIWTEAQKSVSRKIDLNPLQRRSNNVPPDTPAALHRPGAWNLISFG